MAAGAYAVYEYKTQPEFPIQDVQEHYGSMTVESIAWIISCRIVRS
ncbi:MAG: hypothetical protein J6U54_19185 [Clostridiales bacterium]|nr:hypothetical protein [Clostridiales bacterium]